MTQSGHRRVLISDMTLKQEIPWKRVGIEAMAIVASILMAFAIDAWWQERQESNEEQVALEALRQEFLENIELLQAAHEVHVNLAETADRLNLLVSSTADGEVIQVTDSLLVVLITFRTPEVAAGTLNTLLASGRIGIIRDREVQQALAGWPALVENAYEDEVLVRNFLMDQLIPGLAGRVDLTGVMAARTTSGLVSGNAFNLSGQEYGVRVDAITRTLIGQRAYLARMVISGSQSRLDGAEAILALIESAQIRH